MIGAAVTFGSILMNWVHFPGIGFISDILKRPDKETELCQGYKFEGWSNNKTMINSFLVESLFITGTK